MKKFTLIIGILVAANVLNAQGRKEKAREKVEIKIAEHKERLNLTEDQVGDLKKLREEMKPQLEEIRKDESLSRSDKMRAHADLLDERDAELEKILDEDQLAELDEIRKEVQKQREERMEKRRERRAGDDG